MLIGLAQKNKSREKEQCMEGDLNKRRKEGR